MEEWLKVGLEVRWGNTEVAGIVIRAFGDGHQIWADIRVTSCDDKRGIGRIVSKRLKDVELI